MARSLNGNLIGRAAQIDRFDRIQADLDRRSKFSKDFMENLERLQSLDPDGWAAWWDSCPQQTNGEMLQRMREQIEFIETAEWLAEDDRDFQRTRNDNRMAGYPI